MRPIKFRAKRTDNHPVFWAYGYLVKTPITAEFNDVHGAFFDSASAEKTEWAGRYCIVTEHGVAHEIDIETVGQFTGLLDKNSVEIYEGDFLNWNNDGLKWLVVWEDGAFRMKLIETPASEVPLYENLFNRRTKYLQVIGNKWEDPRAVETPATKE